MSRGLRFESEEAMRRHMGRIGAATQPAAKPHKYRAQPTVTDDGRFASKAEAARWEELKLLERAGHITALQRQVRFRLTLVTLDGPQHIEDYIADHVYFDVANRAFRVEDVKGMRTRDYLRKKRLLKEIYGLDIHEV